MKKGKHCKRESIGKIDKFHKRKGPTKEAQIERAAVPEKTVLFLRKNKGKAFSSGSSRAFESVRRWKKKWLPLADETKGNEREMGTIIGTPPSWNKMNGKKSGVNRRCANPPPFRRLFCRIRLCELDRFNADFETVNFVIRLSCFETNHWKLN